MDYIKNKDDESYNEYIKRILQSRPNIRIKSEYQEKHHIIPKCLGGDNKKQNLVWLFPQQHYIAHMMLSNEYPEEQKFVYALWRMSVKGKQEQKRIVTPQQYAQARIKYINVMTGKKREFSEEHKRKISQSKCGKTHKGYPMSEQQKAKLRQSAIKRISDKSFLQKMRDVQKKKPVMCWQTKQIFSCSGQASEKTGATQANINTCCRKPNRTAKGFHWCFVQDANTFVPISRRKKESDT